MKRLLLIVILATLVATGCTYYQATPAGVYTNTAITTTSKFDRSWSAAVGAFSDQNVRITSKDRGTGIIRGTRNGIEVTGNIRSQADGSVRVQIDTAGATANDPTLIDRITHSYNSRMGR